MRSIHNRRSFLKSSAAMAGGLLGLGDFGFLGRLPRVTAAEGTLDPKFVRFRPEIEPLVRLLEESPRERVLEEVAARIQKGATYREVLAALLLAGVRNIQPRPVGFKFHAVLVVNSAHLASQNSPDRDRWLPMFWAVDQFKASQARDVKEGDWTMSAVDESAVPGADRAEKTFVEAMSAWDTAKADVAVAGLARSTGAQEVFDLFCRFGARDFRDIGHKAIYVANSWRTLQTIGWQHAEPVLRSLAYALLEHEGENPAQRDAEQDRPGRTNLERMKKIRADWMTGETSADATREMLTALREGTWEQSCDKAVELLNRRVAPQCVWDALFQHAAEMLMRKPGIVALHASTSTNALHYSWQHTFNDETRRFLLLQNCAFLPMFRQAAGANTGVKIEDLAPAEPPAGKPPGAEDVFVELSRDKASAARMALAHLRGSGDATAFIQAAQRMIYLKGTDSHDYKFSSAVLEDYYHASPSVRDAFLAASVYWLKGATGPDSPLVARTRSALGA
jgi:hypothetical protein